MEKYQVRSMREAKINGYHVKTLQYGEIPETVKNQIVDVWVATLGKGRIPLPPLSPKRIGVYVKMWVNDADFSATDVNTIWKDIYHQYWGTLGTKNTYDLAAEELEPDYDPLEKFKELLLSSTTSTALDIIEFIFHAIIQLDDAVLTNLDPQRIHYTPPQAVEKLNSLFQENGVGYQFRDEILVRVDSILLDQEVIAPAMSLLSDPLFLEASVEFDKAMDFYRKADFPQAIFQAGKAFEMMLANVCNFHHFSLPSQPTMSTYIQSIITNGMLPSLLESELSSLRAALEGVGTLRNRVAHGQPMFPAYIVAYMLHLTATNVVMIYEAHKAFQPTK